MGAGATLATALVTIAHGSSSDLVGPKPLVSEDHDRPAFERSATISGVSSAGTPSAPTYRTGRHSRPASVATDSSFAMMSHRTLV